MGNVIQLIQKYSSKAWDKVYKRESISSVLDGQKELMNFTGAKTVKIARFMSSGLSNYQRANNGVRGAFGGDGHDTAMTTGYGYGYQQGAAGLVWEEFTINCDRGVQLRIDIADDEETNGLAVAAATTETSRTQVIPEVDAYVFSKIAEYAGTTKPVNIVPSTTLGIGSAGNPVYELNEAFLTLANNEIPETDQIIFCSNAFYNALRNTGEIVKTLRQTEYKENVKFTIGEYEGREIIAVPPSRFRTAIKLLDGGYGWEANAKDINFIVMPKDAATHVVKYDKVKVFEPGVVQDYDGYKINIRVYHDLFVTLNKRPAIYVCVKEDVHSAAASSERSLTFTHTLNGKSVTITNVTVKPNGDLVKALYLSTETLAIGSLIADATTATLVAVGEPTATLENGSYKLYGVENGMVVALSTTEPIVING